MADLNKFAEWLSTTSPSVFIQKHEAWMIPTIQSIHIVGIGLVVGSILMVALRIFGVAGTDQTLGQTHSRFAPWISWSLVLLLVTGLLMVIGEPVRELVTVSFWVKMALVLAIVAVGVAFRNAVAAQAQRSETAGPASGSARLAAALTLLALVLIIMLGRFIAYDHVWGPLSPATKA